MDDNPYASPEADLVSSVDADAQQGTVTPAVIELMGRTKTWVRVVGVILWIGFAFMVLGILGMLMASIGGALALAGGEGEGMPGFGESFMVLGMLAGYVVSAAVYIFPTIKVWAYGSRIQDLLDSHSLRDLEAALDAQRSFWTFVAIAFLVMIGVYALFFIGAFVAMGLGAFGAMS